MGQDPKWPIGKAREDDEAEVKGHARGYRAVPEATEQDEDPDVEGHGRMRDADQLEPQAVTDSGDDEAEVEGHMPFKRATPINQAVPDTTEQDEDPEVEGHAARAKF